MRRSHLLALAFIVALPVHVAGQGGRPDVVELPPPLDRVLRDYEQAWRAGDAAGLSELFDADGMIKRQEGWVQGRDNIARAYGNASGPLHLWAVDFGVDGSIAFVVGIFSYDDQPATARGKFILVLRKDDTGRWRIAADLDSG